MTYKMDQNKLNEIVTLVAYYRPNDDVNEAAVLEILKGDFEHLQLRDWLEMSSAEDIAWWILDFAWQE